MCAHFHSSGWLHLRTCFRGRWVLLDPVCDQHPSVQSWFANDDVVEEPEVLPVRALCCMLHPRQGRHRQSYQIHRFCNMQECQNAWENISETSRFPASGLTSTGHDAQAPPSFQRYNLEDRIRRLPSSSITTSAVPIVLDNSPQPLLSTRATCMALPKSHEQCTDLVNVGRMLFVNDTV